MIQQAPPTVPVLDVAALCEIAELEPESRELVEEGIGPREFVDRLLENERFADAVRFLAFVLPRREAIFWAWSSARRVLPEEPAPNISAAIEATGRWIAHPTEEHRRPMLALAEAAELGTPAGCAALAVFLSGGSIAPPDLPPVEPEHFASARAISGCVVLAAVSSEPEKAPEKFRDFIAQGIDVGRRIGLWAPDPPPS